MVLSSANGRLFAKRTSSHQPRGRGRAWLVVPEFRSKELSLLWQRAARAGEFLGREGLDGEPQGAHAQTTVPRSDRVGRHPAAAC